MRRFVTGYVLPLCTALIIAVVVSRSIGTRLVWPGTVVGAVVMWLWWRLVLRRRPGGE